LAIQLGDALSLAVHGLADAMYSERGLLRAFMLRGAADPNIAGPGSTASQVVGAAFKAAVLASRDEIEHPDPELAADIADRIVYDVLARQVMYGPTFESTTNIAWSDLVDQLIVAAFADPRRRESPLGRRGEDYRASRGKSRSALSP
jgi:hypothetical protein